MIRRFHSRLAALLIALVVMGFGRVGAAGVTDVYGYGHFADGHHGRCERYYDHRGRMESQFGLKK